MQTVDLSSTVMLRQEKGQWWLYVSADPDSVADIYGPFASRDEAEQKATDMGLDIEY